MDNMRGIGLTLLKVRCPRFFDMLGWLFSFLHFSYIKCAPSSSSGVPYVIVAAFSTSSELL